jgi:hypothetical protein
MNCTTNFVKQEYCNSVAVGVSCWLVQQLRLLSCLMYLQERQQKGNKTLLAICATGDQLLLAVGERLLVASHDSTTLLLWTLEKAHSTNQGTRSMQVSMQRPYRVWVQLR